jgi:hypothetical protein
MTKIDEQENAIIYWVNMGQIRAEVVVKPDKDMVAFCPTGMSDNHFMTRERLENKMTHYQVMLDCLNEAKK